MKRSSKSATSRSGLFYGRLPARLHARLHGLVLLSVVALSGCSLLEQQPALDSVLGEAGSPAIQSLREVFFGPEDFVLSDEEIAALPFYGSYMQFEDQAQFLAALGADDGHSLHWYSSAQEALTISLGGRLLRTDAIVTYNLEHVSDSRQDPLVCLQAQGDDCERSWQRVITLSDPDGDYQRWQLSSTFDVSVDGYYLVIREQGEALPLATEANAASKAKADNTTHSFSNEFYYLYTNNQFRVEKSRQWVGPELGYLRYEEAKAYPRLYAEPGSEAANTYDPSVLERSETLSEPPSLATSNGQQPMWIRVERSNGTLVDIVTESEPRLSDIIAQVPYSQEVFWPQTFISSPALEQQFAARKQGMHIRLKMLAQTYRHDGETELAAQAEQLAQDFLQWPLQASYRRDITRGQMFVNFEKNPLLNVAQSGIEPGSNSQQPHYWIKLRSQYQPEQLPSLPIADKDLPKGFRDVNQQLGLFLQYWDFGL